MEAYRVEATVEQSGTLTLHDLPFQTGDPVEIIVLEREGPANSENPYPLRGTPIRYERPTDPVAEDDWEAPK